MLAEVFRSIFRFRKTTVSLLCVLTYAIIGIFYVYDHTHYKYVLPSSSDFHRSSALLENAWLDLQNITETFHPYTSRANVEVHDYLLERVTNITQSVPFAKVSDDVAERRSTIVKRVNKVNSTTSFGQISYFESGNILVKLEGKISELPALLLSAHYDSVPTGRGATDDGKGIVSLLGILDYYAAEQPKRTMVFNFNNNEEFGLLGAEAFFSHPWSNLTRYFINLEGTGTGGKSVLFRTSDASTAKMYQKAVVKSPFGNSIYQQGFNDRLVRSETDFVVYARNEMRGFDIAFYKPRDLYHTVKDSIQYTSREALWHMFHTAWQLSDYMVMNSNIDDEDLTAAVFFDILGLRFVTMSAKTLFRWGSTLLVLMPVLTFLVDFIGRKKNKETKGFWNVWLRLPLSLAISIGLVRGTQSFIQAMNPFIISRDYLSPLFALSSEFVLINYLVLSLFEYLSRTADFKTIALRELAVLLWINLFVQTVKLYTSGYKETGTYPFTIFYMTTSLGCIMGYICRSFGKKRAEPVVSKRPRAETSYGSQIVDEERGGEPDQQSIGSRRSSDINENGSQHEHSEEAPLDERAPLLQTSKSKDDHKNKPIVKGLIIKALNYDWSLQFLITLPIATFFLFNSVDLILDALNQTIQEGSKSTINTWNILFLGSILIVLPLLPFTYKLNYLVGLLFAISFGISLALSLLQSPFTEQSPLKLRFEQTVDLNNSTNAIVSVLGRKGGFVSSVLDDLPSVKEQRKQVWCESLGDGNEQCSYVGYPPNLFDSSSPLKPHDIFGIEILKDDRKSADRSSYAPINAVLRINAKENRACNVRFDSKFNTNSPVRQITIDKEGMGKNTTLEVIKLSSGINEVQLHKLDFDKPYYNIGVQWLPNIINTNSKREDRDADALEVTVTCFWGEYDSESQVGQSHKRKLPAFDELLEYSPVNVIYTNREKGLFKFMDSVTL